MVEILWHRRETRRLREKTNLNLWYLEKPVYSTQYHVDNDSVYYGTGKYDGTGQEWDTNGMPADGQWHCWEFYVKLNSSTVITKISENTTYYARLRAFDASGKFSLNSSTISSKTTMIMAPNKPQGLRILP